MALFTDGPPSSIDDLAAQDAQLLTVSQVEGIDVTQKLALAWDELGLELYTMLNQFGTENRLFWQPPRPNLATVVVTPSLKLWYTFRSLEMVYEDAYNSQLNDRYAGKRDFFHERAMWACQKLAAIGIGIATAPVAKASIPSVTAVPVVGAPLSDGMYYVTSAWVNQSGDEGAAADAASVSTVGGTFTVQQGPPPQNATGWNVYAGTDPNGMTLQNGSLLEVEQIWVQPVPLVDGGRGPGTGQAPSYLKLVPPVIQRG
jgi:hypothetical protein